MLEKWKLESHYMPHITSSPLIHGHDSRDDPSFSARSTYIPRCAPPPPAPLPAGRARVQPLSASSGQCPRYTSDFDWDCLCSRHICLQMISLAGHTRGIAPGCTQRVVPEAHIGPQATLLLLGVYLPLGAAPKGYAQGTCLSGDVLVTHLPCDWPPSTWGRKERKPNIKDLYFQGIYVCNLVWL